MVNLTPELLALFRQYAPATLAGGTSSSMNYTDPNTGMVYAPSYSNGGIDGQGNPTDGTLTGYYGGMPDPDHDDSKNVFTGYDLNGNATSQFMGNDFNSEFDSDDLTGVLTVLAGLAGGVALAGAGAGGAAVEGGIGGAFTPAELASFEAGGLGGQGALGLDAITAGGGTFLGEGMASGIPEWDAAATNAGLDLTTPAATAGLGPGTNTNPVFNGAQDSQLYNASTGTPPVLTNPSGPAIPYGTTPGMTPTPVGTPYSPTPLTPTPTGTTTVPRVPPIPSTGGGGNPTTGSGGGNLDLSSLFQLLGGAWDMNNQNNASQQMLDYLKQRQGINDNMYAPGSPEATALWDEMSRKDAAAGRNSQYGPRSVDLGARIAQLKMDANTRMTTGIGSLYQNAINQGAGSNAGLLSALGNLFGGSNSGSGSGLNLGNLINQITGGSNNISGVGNEVPGSNGSDNGGIQTNNGGLNTWPELGD